MPLASRVLIVFATLATAVALLGTWAHSQLLDTPRWTATSEELLRDGDVRRSVADAVARQVPPVVRERARLAARQILSSPEVESLWAEANRATHRQLVVLIERDRGDDRALVLDLRPIALAAAQRAGLSSIPPVRGRVVIARPAELDTARSAARVLDTLAWLPAAAAVLLYLLALALARGARVRALVAIGVSLVVAGLLALAARAVAGHEVVDAVAGGSSYEDTASAVWRIATELLGHLALGTIIAGLVLAAFAVAWTLGTRSRERRA